MDEEIRAAFQELQAKVVDTNQRMQMAEHQKMVKAGQLRKLILTAQEVDPLPAETPMYNSHGKMFLLTDKESVLDALEAQAKEADAAMKKIEEAKGQLQMSLKDSENALREFIKQKQSQAASS
eukprot:m.355032 g.355032  ORF g.355032 m.355032 type:complete len:123 (-) comp17164_c0_seq1:248-616(-)